jgi:hypothetical protein
MSLFGEYNEDGSIKTDATLCAVTNRPLGANVRARVPGTNYFFRMRPDVARTTTQDKREAIYKECVEHFKTVQRAEEEEQKKAQRTASQAAKAEKMEAE